ncbi:hypothetical protein [Pedobacter sp. MW01-1-1]|uniref:hypothetical protein n=1 Tax=Pedobacter sp. MW01-1-1 TaxID=3383027 RepID=UPI003FF0105F
MCKFCLSLILCVFLLSVKSSAQNSNIGLGAELAFPSGNYANVSSIGTGASVKADFGIATNFALTANIGFMNFFGKTNFYLKTQDLTYIPLKAGLKYFFSEGFYVEGQLGASLPVKDNQKTLFVWSPGFGTFLRLPGKNKLDLGIRYEGWSGTYGNIPQLNSTTTNGFAALRFAYVFAL